MYSYLSAFIGYTDIRYDRPGRLRARPRAARAEQPIPGTSSLAPGNGPFANFSTGIEELDDLNFPVSTPEFC